MTGGPTTPHPSLPERAEVFWSDQVDRPEPGPRLEAKAVADLVIVGAGYTGLWAAVQAAEADPGRRVVVVEAETIGFGASSRNGGFCDASLTHGLSQGLHLWPDEIETLTRLGAENLDGLLADVARWGIDADVHRVEELSVAVRPWQIDDLAEEAQALGAAGIDHELLEADRVRERLDSPTYLGGLITRDNMALVDPARLAWGLADAARNLGVVMHERSPVDEVVEAGSGLRVVTAGGSVDTDRVVVATNAWGRPSKPMRRRIIPIYDHVLMTEPLTTEQRTSIGWSNGEGVSDAGNRFHYYRPTEDGRILWGGWDANYYYGNGIGPDREDRIASHDLLARHFFETFPQLEGLRFSHRWAGPIGTTSRFTAGWGRTNGGRVVWVGGYTGLGVGASRFGARVALDLVDGVETERTGLAMVRSRPMPWPPEPVRWSGVQLTKRAIARADERGKRGPLLSLLDRLGLGFDS